MVDMDIMEVGEVDSTLVTDTPTEDLGLDTHTDTVEDITPTTQTTHTTTQTTMITMITTIPTTTTTTFIMIMIPITLQAKRVGLDLQTTTVMLLGQHENQS